jgi:DNA-binding MarR family transcriptional regulator
VTVAKAKKPSVTADTPAKLVCGVTPREYRILMAAIKAGKCTREELIEKGILTPSVRSRNSDYLNDVLAKLGK